MFDKSFLIQMAGSAVAVGVLIAISAWAKIARPTPPMTLATARDHLAEEFPDLTLDAVWVADDGQGAIARSGDSALVLETLGDGYVARQVAWAAVSSSQPRNGRLTIPLGEPGAPELSIAIANWPPGEGA